MSASNRNILNEIDTLVDLLNWRAQSYPDCSTYTFLNHGEAVNVSLSNQKLAQQAKGVGAQLQALNPVGKRILLLLSPGLDYIAAFLGCVYAGAVAVPVYPPRANRRLSRLQAIISDAQPSIVLTTSDLLTNLGSLGQSKLGLDNLTWLSVDEISCDLANQWQEPSINGDSLAFLQYTSGSTAAPKGVMVSHRNLLHNLGLIGQHFDVSAQSRGVIWLPPYHDMGLIGGILQPLYAGFNVALMRPVDFLQQPIRWLQAISQNQANISGGPNFAYELCLNRITPEAMTGLDLSTWDVAFSGAEPVRIETLDRFVKTFEPCGFRREAFYPCYGMAEATLFISGGQKSALPICQNVKDESLQQQEVVYADRQDKGISSLVGCGKASYPQSIVIVHPESCCSCDENQVGEIWVSSSASIAQGYWNQPKKTQAVFHAYLSDTGAGPFLRTGDLGFLHDGELFITGRLKDLIIIRGRNYYPQDIELTVEQAHPALRPGSGAAFAIDVNAQEQLVVVQEVHRRRLRNLNVPEIAQAIRQAITEHHDLRVYAILLLKTGSIPKTSSGKIQRHACKEGFQANTLNVVGDWLENPRYKSGVKRLETDLGELEQQVVNTQSTSQSFSQELLRADKDTLSVTAIENWLTIRLARYLNIDASEINSYEPFSSYGLDSAAAVSLSGELEEWLGQRLSPTLIYDYPSIIQLSQYLAIDALSEPVVAAVNETKIPPDPSRYKQEDIAIIGLGCRFPGADSSDAFWDLLSSGQSAVAQVSRKRLELEDYANGSESEVRWGGFLEAIDQFDAAFFGIAPREAEKIDPQQRWLLEVAWEALEHAGQSPAQLSGSQTGVFVGISSNDYVRKLMANPIHIDAYMSTGNALSIAANRLSYVLNLQGPSLAVDTACSSSLVALHLACQSLRQGECNLALAGGINALLSPELTQAFSEAQMMAADGRCKTFDIDADGYVRGEGCGVVVLKRLSEARVNGDRILAVIRGSAINQDGRSNGLTAPNGPAQQAVIRQALANANVAPADIQYVETHGTGTPLGDPIEVDALQSVLAVGRSQEAKCYLGSVKTNLGHLEAAAGIAGLIKVVLALQHQEIPPHLNFNQLNPYITLKQPTFNIATELQRWEKDNPLRLVGVSSFGFGGTNAHVILEAVDSIRDRTELSPQVRLQQTDSSQNCERSWQLLALSAKTEPALQELLQRYQNFLSEVEKTALADICFTANTGRAHFSHRVAIATSSKSELQSQLTQLLEGRSDAGRVTGGASTNSPPKIAFLFTGQGAQYVQMGRQLYDTCPRFRQILGQCDAILRDELGESLLAVLYPPNNEQDDRIDQTCYTQPALFALEYALAELWQSWGITPDVVMGHSVGEYVAACVAGVFDLATGLKLIAARARLMQALPVGGKMAVVFAEASRVESAISSYDKTVTLAAINGPKSVVVSGLGHDVDSLAEQFKKQEIRTRELEVSHAFHSPLMAPMLAEFEQVTEEMTFAAPQIPLITNTTGQLWPADTIPDAQHWQRHVSAPVQFYVGMQTLKQQGCNCIVEIGPNPTLLGMGRYCWPEDEASLWLLSLKQGQPDWQLLLESLAHLYIRGMRIDWSGFEQDYDHCRVTLPTYPFQRQSYWLSSTPTAVQRTVSTTGHPLLGQRLGSALKEIQFESHLSPGAPAFLKHHQVFDAVVLPATGYLEMALSAGALVLKSTTLVLEDIVIQSALIFTESASTQTVQTIVTPVSSGTAEFEIFSVAQSDNHLDLEAEQVWTSHAKGNVKPGVKAEPTVDLSQLQAQCAETIDVEQYYQSLRAQGLDYGDNFQAIQQLWRADRQALGYICLPEELTAEIERFHIHPVLLDACFQTVAAALTVQDQVLTYLPTLIKQLSVFRSPGESVWCHVQLRKQSKTRGIRVDLSIWDGEGRAIAHIDQLHLLPVTRERLLGTSQADWHNWLYQVAWRQQVRHGGEQLAAQLRSPNAVEEQLAAPINALFAQPDVVAYTKGLAKLEDLSAAYVVQAFQQLGWEFSIGQRLTTAAIIEQFDIVPQHQRLLRRLLAMLVEEGWLQNNGGDWVVVSTPVISEPSHQQQRLLAQYPNAVAELTLLERCGTQLATVLQGHCDPLQLLFPEGDLTLLTQLYQESPGARVMNMLVQQVVDATLNEIPPEQGVRILEIGAGTGGTTAGLLPMLPEDQTDYWFTDVSPLFTTRAQDRFADYPFVHYDILDIEQDPTGQGFEPHQYHLILAANVLHATSDLRQTLEHVKQLLVPGGSLVFLEGTTPVRWLDLVFGLTEGWWRFTDTELRADHPLLKTEQWQALLKEIGFSASAVLPSASDGAALQSVIVAQTSVQPAQSSGSWLIFADDQGVAASLSAQLQATGADCLQVKPGEGYDQIAANTFTVNPTYPEDFQQLLQKMQSDGLSLQGIVHLWSLDAQVSPHLSTADLEAASIQSCGSVLHLVQALGRTQMQSAPLWLVTQGAVRVADEILSGLAQSPLWGMGRTLALEHPELRGFRVDLDPAAELSAKVRMLSGEILSDRAEDQVALRNQGRYVARLRPHGSELGTDDRPWRLAMPKQGTLEDLQLQPLERQVPQASEVEIQVRATGLNFLDVLDALGLLPFERGWFGAECAGEVVAVGPEVEDFSVGDAVVAIAPGSFSQYVTVTKELVAPKPAELSFEAAATIPVNFLTAYYALRQVANLSPGERVLIHAAAGGTGMAAVQLAQLAGAEVFATASPEKWETLRALGVTHIMNSRTLAFAEEVMSLTQGQGVDCVFNSLAGEFIPKSLSVLTETGCFIEIGKNNIWSLEQVHQLKPNLHYAIVDLFQYSYQEPAAIQAMLRTLFEMFGKGDLKPLPLTAFPIESVTDAFRYMQQAKHVGKVVVAQPAKVQPITIHPEGTYVITGGLGGLGLLLTEWLVDQGAQHIMLLSRRDPSDEVQAQLSTLKAKGAQVIVAQADVTQSSQLAQALAQAPSPLRGVIHAAGVLADGILQQIPWQRFSTVLAPKVAGAWNLHQLTCEQPLDFFILFSSAASLLGSPGQANHAAANAFLDALAHYRQAQGLTGLSLNWGAWTEIGAAAKKQAAAQMALKGVGAITPQAGEQTFMPLLSQQKIPQIGVVPLNWPQFLAQWPTTNSFFADFMTQETLQQGGQQAKFLQQLESVPKTEWRSHLTHHLRQQMATVLGFSSVEDVDLRQGFFDLGMDSLTAVELKNRLQTSLGCSLPTTLVFDYPTGEAVVDYLTQTVLGLDASIDAAPEQGIESSEDVLADQVNSLSETEIADLLQQELVAIEQGRQA